MNASHTPDTPPPSESQQKSPVPTIEKKADEQRDASVADKDDTLAPAASTNGADTNADSEAETEIESPVKKREAERQHQQQQQNAAPVVKSEKSQRSRIGSLPVPHDDDDDGDSTGASPLDSTELDGSKTTSPAGDAKADEDADMMDAEGSEHDSDELSSPQSDDDASLPPSRATSERPRHGVNGDTESPNPRKRKHRASSVSLPNSKRQSMDPPKRTRLRGMHSEDAGATERSPSPRPRSHRRTVSTQSALEGDGAGRKRRSIATVPNRETKSAKTWEESDASSETTSRGQEDRSRPQRNNRWSSATPGRPSGREAKRHVNKYGFTRLAEACENNELDEVKEWLDKDPDQLELAEFAGNKPLQIAALNGNDEIVSYLIARGCQIDCANVDKDTPLIDAAENGHLGVVKLLLEAGVDPLRQNLKGQQALDVVTDETDDAIPIRAALHAAIDAWNSSESKQRREAEEEDRHTKGPSKEIHFMARTYENLVRLVQINDRNGVREFLSARVPVDNAVIAAAAKTGDLYLVNMLLAEMSEKKAVQKPEKPMLSVLGSSHFEMVRALTDLEHFNPLWVNRAGKSWSELAEERNGPHWRQEKELLQKLIDERRSRSIGDRRSSSPVAKRDRVKRRFDVSFPIRQEDDTSEDVTEEEGRGKKRNGRKLMSRRDMRARSGNRALDDSSEGEEDEDAEGEVDEEAQEATAVVNDEPMQPPESPTTRRRLRSKSISSPGQAATSIEPSPKGKTLRRRSSSLRGQELPPVREEKDETAAAPSSTPQESAKVKQEREAEAQARIDEARRLAEKQKQEEEARRAEEAAAAQLAAEERRAEEERQAEEQRQAAMLREREAAEQARRDEEARIQREREAEQARKAYEAEVFDALPSALAHVLDPEQTAATEFGDAEWQDWVTQHLLPFRAVSDPGVDASGPWILNLQAAPLLATNGAQLFFKLDRPGFDDCLADRWDTYAPCDEDWRVVDQVLARLVQTHEYKHNQIATEEAVEDDDDYHEDLKQIAARLNAFTTISTAFRRPDCPVALRRVRWTDVEAAMRSALQGMKMDFMHSTSSTTARTNDGRAKLLALSGAAGNEDFVSRLRTLWQGRSDGSSDPETRDTPAAECVRLSEVVWVHEK